MYVAITRHFDKDGKLAGCYKSHPSDCRDDLVKELEKAGFKPVDRNHFEANAENIEFLFDDGRLEAEILDLSDRDDADRYIGIFAENQPVWFQLETITHRYAVYERGLLQSMKKAESYGPYANCDTFAEAAQVLKDIHDIGLTGFILDKGTGATFDYATIDEIC